MIATNLHDLKHLRGQLAEDMKELVSRGSRGARFGRHDFHLLNVNQELLDREIERRERQERSAAGDEYHAAWLAYMRNGLTPSKNQPGIPPEQRAILVRGERRDMGTGGQAAYPGATSGFLVPTAFSDAVESAMTFSAPMMMVARTFPTATGSPLGYPTTNDTSVIGEQVAESGQVAYADVPLSQITFKSYKYSTKMVKISVDFLQDSAFAIDDFLAGVFGFRLGRVLGPLFTTGTGSGQPKGIIPAATVGVSSATTPAIIGNDNATTPDPTQQVGFLDLVNLEQSLDPQYRLGASFMLSTGALGYVKTLKDGSGRPLHAWRPEGGPFGSINGYAAYPNPDMATLAAGNKTVAFGRLDKYVIRRAGPMVVQRLEERYAEYGQVAFIGFARYDGNLLDAGTHPVVALQQHA